MIATEPLEHRWPPPSTRRRRAGSSPRRTPRPRASARTAPRPRRARNSCTAPMRSPAACFASAWRYTDAARRSIASACSGSPAGSRAHELAVGALRLGVARRNRTTCARARSTPRAAGLRRRASPRSSTRCATDSARSRSSASNSALAVRVSTPGVSGCVGKGVGEAQRGLDRPCAQLGATAPARRTRLGIGVGDERGIARPPRLRVRGVAVGGALVLHRRRLEMRRPRTAGRRAAAGCPGASRRVVEAREVLAVPAHRRVALGGRPVLLRQRVVMLREFEQARLHGGADRRVDGRRPGPPRTHCSGRSPATSWRLPSSTSEAKPPFA